VAISMACSTKIGNSPNPGIIEIGVPEDLEGLRSSRQCSMQAPLRNLLDHIQKMTVAMKIAEKNVWAHRHSRLRYGASPGAWQRGPLPCGAGGRAFLVIISDLAAPARRDARFDATCLPVLRGTKCLASAATGCGLTMKCSSCEAPWQ
jgi:hypothetical protein